MNAHTNLAFFRFQGAAKDLLKNKLINPDEPVTYSFDTHPSVKDAIESLGPPHTEIIAILVNSKPESFEYLMQDKDVIDVYSFDTSPDIPSQLLLPNKPRTEPTFILDVHMGALSSYLRFAGFDTLYDSCDLGDNALANISHKESRILLTRDIGLLKHAKISYGHWLRNTQPKKQFLEVALRYDLYRYVKPFSRCSLCNGLISKVEKKYLKDKISTSLYGQFDEFWQCQSCSQVYWKGKHFHSIEKSLNDMIFSSAITSVEPTKNH